MGYAGGAEGQARFLLPLRCHAKEGQGDDGGGRQRVHEAAHLHEEEDGRADVGGKQQCGCRGRKPDRQLLREGERALPGGGVILRRTAWLACSAFLLWGTGTECR